MENLDLKWFYDYSFGKACIVDVNGDIVIPFFETSENIVKKIVKEHNKTITQLDEI